MQCALPQHVLLPLLMEHFVTRMYYSNTINPNLVGALHLEVVLLNLSKPL